MQIRARILRRQMPITANRMWYFLRNRRLCGYKFVRELAIGKYIVDFVCREKKLILEIDGEQHVFAKNYDVQRTIELEKYGYKVLRFWNRQVFLEIESVLEEILLHLEGKK